MENVMRKYFMMMSFAAFLAPQAALACASTSSSSISVDCQAGVQVYRGTPLSAPTITIQRVQDRASTQAFAVQQALIRAQDRRIDSLEDSLKQATNPPRTRRGRYNRSFGVPIGAFGRGVGSGFGGRINSRLGGSISFARSGAFGGRRF